MSVEITVSWRFVPHGSDIELAGSPFDFDPKISEGTGAPEIHKADHVLPLGSSVVAPGFAMLMPRLVVRFPFTSAQRNLEPGDRSLIF